MSRAKSIALPRSYPALPRDKTIELGIRPEFVALRAKGQGLPVTVRRIDDLGRARIARVEMRGWPLAASVPENLAIDGDEASLVIDERQIHIYADGHLVGEAR